MDIFSSRHIQTILLISMGAVLGANLRYWLGVWINGRWGSELPVATLVINITGSLLLGFFITLASERLLIDPRWRVFFAIGFLGSYTTFSTYSYESAALLLAGQFSWGLLNLVGSGVLGGLAVVVGMVLGRLA